jgi:sirohydrochlorin cobaltochelatase
MTPHRGIILFAHGSRDPGWRQPIEAVAQRLAQRSPALRVACAYLELNEPDLPAAVDALVAAGAVSLVVLPMFLGVGKHARQDLPALVDQVRQRHPSIELALAPALGEQAAVLDFLAETAAKFA